MSRRGDEGVVTYVPERNRKIMLWNYCQYACLSEGSSEGGRGGIHQGMRETDFGTVNSSIARGLHEGEQVGIFGVEYYLIKSFLYSLSSAQFHHEVLWCSALFTHVYSVSRRHLGGCASAEISDNVARCKDTLEQKATGVIGKAAWVLKEININNAKVVSGAEIYWRRLKC